MARRSQQSSAFDDRRDRDRLPPHYKETYRLAIDVLVEQGRDAFRDFLQREGAVAFLSEPEVDHIERTFQSPALATRGDDAGGNEVDQDFDSLSSGTYWPVYSDTSAPDLELGWPEPGRFLGQTNVALYFHPPLGDGAMTIKEVIRRHIRGASKVVAVVMDVFTDVDIFQELLEAATVRRVPVYLLHDRINFPLFHEMCVHHGLRPSELENMRVRTLPGTLYYCKSGAKFHGQVFEKFMLFDCVTALCGSYSLTWSHEKIHRSLVHEFTGEMVDTFDEEFRVLYAQSSCPYDDASAVAVPGRAPPPDPGLLGLRGLHCGARPGLAPQVIQHDSSVDSWVSSASSRRALERQTLSFSRHDFVRSSVDKVYSRGDAGQLQREDRFTFTAEQEVLSEREYRGGQLFAGERELWKRFSYAGEATEPHPFLRRPHDPHPFAAGRAGAPDPQPRTVGLFSGQEARRLRAGAGAYGERFAEGVFDGTAFPDSAGHAKRIAAKEEETETRDVSQQQQQQFAAYGQRKRSDFPAQHLMNSRREAWQGQPGRADGGGAARHTFACQTSPTQTHFKEEAASPKAGAAKAREGADAGAGEKSAKQGLRRWRINSFLSSCENPAEAEARPEDDAGVDGDDRSGGSSLGTQEGGGGRGGSPASDAAPGLTRHESLRSKINPMLQRNSRLRSSLIFNSARQDAGGPERGPGNGGALPAADLASDDKPLSGLRASERGAGEPPAEVSAGGFSNVESKPKDVQTAAVAAAPVSDFQSKYGPKEPFVRSRFLFNSVMSRKTPAADEDPDKAGAVARLDSHIKELFPKPSPAPVGEKTNATQARQRDETIAAEQASGAGNAGARPARAPDKEPPGAPQDAKQQQQQQQSSSRVSPALPDRASRLQSFLDKVGRPDENPAEKTAAAPQANALRVPPSPRDPCRPGPPVAGPTVAGPTVAGPTVAGPTAPKVIPTPIAAPDLSSAPAWRGGVGGTGTPMLYGSNLKDDTKAMLEQISMSSHKYKDDNQKAAEQEKAQRGEPPGRCRDAAAGGESAVAVAKEAVPSVGGPEPAEDDKSDELIRNLESKRKENRAYSRFEVFYKTEGTEVKPKVVSPAARTPVVPEQSRYGSDKYRTREPPSSNSLLQKIKVTFKSKN